MEPDRHETVLAVSGEPELLELIAAPLSRAGYRTLTARDAAAAYEAAARHRPSLVITDAETPGGGPGLLPRLRADPRLRRVPVILVGGRAPGGRGPAADAPPAGADDYLESPFDPLRLVAAVARHIERARVERLYREVVERADDIIYTSDRAGRYTSVNPAGERLTGYTREEILSMTWREVVAPEHHAAVEAALARKLAGDEAGASYEVELVAKDGRRVPVEVDSQPVYEGNELTGVQGIARDVTERRRAEAAWHARAEQEAENEKMRSLGQLSAGVAHNFNNALTAILGRTQMLLRQVTDERQQRSLRVIETAAHDAAEIVRRVQTFARRSSGAETGLVSLSQIIADTLQLTRTRWEDDARAAGLRYEVTFANDAGADDLVDGSSSELREVFVNLVFNALDAMPAGGALRIAERREGDGLVVEVADTGPGIPAELQPRIFEPFFTTKGTRGSGLGLAVSYGTLARHGGAITVASEPGRGAAFAVRLPRHTPGRSPARAADAEPPPRRRVLVVDDEEPVREVLADMLREMGQEVETARDAREALDALAASTFDLMITDLSMPGLDGLALAAEVRRLAPRTRVALATGYGHSVPADAVAAGLLDALLQKPVKLAVLEDALRRLFADRG